MINLTYFWKLWGGGERVCRLCIQIVVYYYTTTVLQYSPPALQGLS
jgi:hypothetical protein